MNTPTIVITVFTLWLVMGLGFLAEYGNARKSGKSLFEIWTSLEGLLFIASIIVPIIILLHDASLG